MSDATNDRFGIAAQVTERGQGVIVVTDFVTQQKMQLSLEDASGLAGHLGFAVRATLQRMVQQAQQARIKAENRIVIPGRKN